MGTCLKCDEELKYLERELDRRTKLGKTVVLAGLSACLAGVVSGCDGKEAEKPLLYADFIAEFAHKYKSAGWKIYVETSLNVYSENVEKVLPVVDAFSVDCKDMDPKRYHRYTGGDYSVFDNNLRILLSNMAPDRFQARVPYIEGYNTRKQQLDNEKKLRNMGVTHIQLFDYVIPGNHGIANGYNMEVE